MHYIRIIIAALLVFSSSCMGTASAQFGKTILFVPHDNRPISFKQTVNDVQAAGFNVLTPPQELLGSRDNPGKPDELAKWVENNAGHADYAVISADSMVYGSLVASRKHNIPSDVLQQRATFFSSLHEKYPYLNIYVFGSIMRTPQTSEASSEEPDYYHLYGTQIARYTALLDKKDKVGLNGKEKRELAGLEKEIPQSAIHDWLARRSGNFAVNKYLIDLLKDNDISYLALGCDDNAPYSQTDKERRQLDSYGSAYGNGRYQSVAGLDELGMVMLTRAVNKLQGDIPFVSVHYAAGKGENTIPAYSNELIKDSVRTHINMAGGLQIKNDSKADLLLLLNTDQAGNTYAANDVINTIIPHANTLSFVDMIGRYLKAGAHVGVADIDFGNGADNALMNEMLKRGYLPQLKAYAGWNTPTNSSGYTIGMGMLSSYVNQQQTLKMLMPRYLDDWLYQANIRQTVANELNNFAGTGDYGNTGSRTIATQEYATKLMDDAIRNYGLDKYMKDIDLTKTQVRFPWQRMFEADIVLPEA